MLASDDVLRAPYPHDGLRTLALSSSKPCCDRIGRALVHTGFLTASLSVSFRQLLSFRDGNAVAYGVAGLHCPFSSCTVARDDGGNHCVELKVTCNVLPPSTNLVYKFQSSHGGRLC